MPRSTERSDSLFSSVSTGLSRAQSFDASLGVPGVLRYDGFNAGDNRESGGSGSVPRSKMAQKASKSGHFVPFCGACSSLALHPRLPHGLARNVTVTRVPSKHGAGLEPDLKAESHRSFQRQFSAPPPQFDQVLLQHPQVQAEMIKLFHVAQWNVDIRHLVLDLL